MRCQAPWLSRGGSNWISKGSGTDHEQELEKAALDDDRPGLHAGALAAQEPLDSVDHGFAPSGNVSVVARFQEAQPSGLAALPVRGGSFRQQRRW